MLIIIFSKMSCPKKLEDSGTPWVSGSNSPECGGCPLHIEELVSVRRGRRRREVVSAAGGQFSEKVNSEDPNPIQIQSPDPSPANIYSAVTQIIRELLFVVEAQAAYCCCKKISVMTVSYRDETQSTRYH